MILRPVLGACALASIFLATSADGASPVSDLADQYVSGFASHYPARMMFFGMPYGTSAVFNTNDPTDIRRWQEMQTDLLGRLKVIDPETLSSEDQLTYANVREMIEADLQQAVCRNELWSLDYYTGWQAMLPMYFGGFVESQGAQIERHALDQWTQAILTYLDQEKANLSAGLADGYTAPKSLALRVAQQVESLAGDHVVALADPIDALGDEQIAAEWQRTRQDILEPALIDFATYLRTHYAEKTREEHSLALNRDGVDCFRAKLRSYASIDLDPAELLREAEIAKSASQERFLSLGSEIYGLSGRAAILEALQSDRSADFQGGDEEVMASAKAMANELIEKSRLLFPDLPSHEVNILAYDEASIAAGARASYAGPPDDSYTGRYYLNPQSRDARSSFQLEVTSVHEVAPGHHMQTMVSLHHNRIEEERHDANSLSFIPAYVEGWGNYAQRLALEYDFYSDPRSELVELSTEGRSYVGELRLHMGGSDADFRALYADELANGTISEDYLDAALDRLSMWAGHNSSYTIGGLAILKMREEAKASLGPCFLLPEFHRVVLEKGSVPLWFINRRVQMWVEETLRRCSFEPADDTFEATIIR